MIDLRRVCADAFGGVAECLWDEALPIEVRELSEDLAALDRLLGDPELPGLGWRRTHRAPPAAPGLSAGGNVPVDERGADQDHHARCQRDRATPQAATTRLALAVETPPMSRANGRGVTLVPGSNPDFDLVRDDGTRVQVKGRRVTSNRPHIGHWSAMRGLEEHRFDEVVAVALMRTTRSSGP